MLVKNKSGSEKTPFGQVWNEFRTSYPISQCIQAIIVLLGALLILDYYDIPSWILHKMTEYPLFVVVVVVICGCIFLLAWALRFLHLISVLKFKLVSGADSAFLIAAIALLVYGIVRSTVWKFKYIGLSVFALSAISAFCFGGRMLFLTKVKKDANQYKSNLVDLKDIYLNQFQYERGAPIQIEETDVDYDLLGREVIINQLFQAIVHCQPRKSYVISLEGKWGSGKTTILNSVIHRLREIQNGKIEVISDFDPWLYGNQKALLEAMYNRLISGTGIRCNPHYSEHFLREILNACASEAAKEFHFGRIVSKIFHQWTTNGDNIQELKGRINSYLQVNHKKFVFMIDNLDRADDDNIIFLFKVISIVFDFPGIIYVLSFDRERIDDILKQTHALNHRFLEKIIQQEITVPPMIGEQTQSVFYTCTHNLLVAYGISNKDSAEFRLIYKYIMDQSKDLRRFKRYLNSVLPIVFLRKTSLYLHDLFAIETIRFFQPALYEAIHQNPKYFIGCSPNEYQSNEDEEETGKERMAFSNELKKRYRDSMLLLGELFPNVEQYCSRIKSQDLESVSDEISKQSRISCVAYFDLYFNASTNKSILISDSVKSFIHLANSGVGLSDIYLELVGIYSDMDKNYQKEWTEQLQLSLDDITKEHKYVVAVALTNIYHHINASLVFLSLCAKDRAVFLITKLLSDCTIEEFREYAKSLENHYGYLHFIQGVCYWLDSKQFNDITKNERLPIMQKLYMSLIENVLKDKIDIYQDGYYHKHNSWGLMSYCEKNESLKRCQEYYRTIMSGQTVYRILWDMTGCALSGSYEYYINEETFGKYIGDTQLVNSCIEQHGTLSDSEKFVKQVYDAFLSGEKQYDGRPSPIVSSEEMHVSL